MRLRHLLLLLLLPGPGLASGLPVRQEVPEAHSERIPNIDWETGYPRWLGSVRPFAELTVEAPPTIGDRSYLDSMALAVDSRNNAHIATLRRVNIPDGMLTRVLHSIEYQNNTWAARGINGFSPFRVPCIDKNSENPLQNPYTDILGAPDLWVDDNDTCHFVWTYDTYSNGGVWESSLIRYVSLTAAGTLGSYVTLTSNEESGYTNHKYWAPQIRKGTDGTLHVVAGRRRQVIGGGSGGWDNAIIYIKIPSGQGPSQPDPITASHPEESPAVDRTIRFTLYNDGGVQRPMVVWEERINQDSYTYFARRSSTDWNDHLALGTGPYDKGPDIAVDQAGKPHVVWAKAHTTPSSSGIFYTSRTGTSFTTPVNVASQPITVDQMYFTGARILFDSRGQPQVVWSGKPFDSPIAQLCYAALIGGSWRRQEGVVTSVNRMGHPHDFAITKNDQLHVVDGTHYNRTMEFGLGIRDPLAMVPAFPGAAVNAVSGNLHYRLPLFSTDGLAPSQSMELIYNSLDQYSIIAPGWKSNYDVYLIEHWEGISVPGNPNATEKVTMILPDGRPVQFVYLAGENYLVPEGDSGLYGKLVRSATNILNPYFTLTLNSGQTWVFNQSGKLMSITEPTENHLDLSWSNGQLTQILDQVSTGSNGRISTILYTGDKPTTIQDPALVEYTLGYKDHHLQTVKFAGETSNPTYSFLYFNAASNLVYEFRRPRGLGSPVDNPASGYGWTCDYFPDGRFTGVYDPQENYVDDAGITVLGRPRLQVDSNSTRTWITDRRGKITRFEVEPRRSLAKEIHDPTVLPAAPAGFFPVVRTFSGQGDVLSVQDRRGILTQYTYWPSLIYPFTTPNLKEIKRPNLVSGGNAVVVADYTYSSDGYNRLTLARTYATPADATGQQTRETIYDYDDQKQLEQITHPGVLRIDGQDQTGANVKFSYNSSERFALSKVTNENGLDIEVKSWHPLHKLPLTIQREGQTQVVTREYNALGHLTSLLLPPGAAGNLAPGAMTYELDGLYRLKKSKDAGGFETTYGYDLDSNQSSVLPPGTGAVASTWTFDKRGLPKQGSVPNQTNDWTSKFDANGNLKRHTDTRGHESQWTFDDLNRVTASLIPGGPTQGTGAGGGKDISTTYAHDGYETGKHFTLITQLGQSEVPDRVTKTWHDRRGRPEEIVAPDLTTKTFLKYDDQDQLVSKTLKHGAFVQSCTVLKRDARDRVFQVRLQDAEYPGTGTNSATTTTLYNRANSVEAVVDPLGVPGNPALKAHKTFYERDPYERVQYVRDGKFVIVAEYLYGMDDEICEVKWPDPVSKSATSRTTLFTRTVTARKETFEIRNPGGTLVAKNTYGPLPGQIDELEDALTRKTKHSYWADSHLPKDVKRAFDTEDESVVTREWADGLLKKVSVYNPVSGVYDAHYQNYFDKAGRREKYQPPAPLQPERYFFSPFSEPSKRVMEATTPETPLTVTMSRTNLGFVEQIDWTQAYTARQKILHAWADGSGLASVSHQEVNPSTNAVIRKRDAQIAAWRGAPFLETLTDVGSGNWIKSQTPTVDLAGNLTALTDSQNGAHEWLPDENNRPKEIRYGNQELVSLSYTPGGLLDVVTRKAANGITVISTTTHFYDSEGRPERQLTVQASTNKVVSDLTWVRNAANEVIGFHLNHLAVDFTQQYTFRGELKLQSTPGNSSGTATPSWQNPALGPDPQGNESLPSPAAEAIPTPRSGIPARSISKRYDKGGNPYEITIDGVTRTIAYNAANQPTAETVSGQTVTHTHNSWGDETVRVTTGTGAKTETFAYGYHRRLSGYTDSSASANNYNVSYWPDGNRFARTQGAQSLVSIDLNGEVVNEFDQTGAGTPTPKNSFAGLGLHGKVTRIPASGSRTHLVGDQVNSLSSTLDESGAAIESLVKDAWGATISGATAEPFAGINQAKIDPSGLHVLGHRMYDSRIGRFTQTDPLLASRATEHYVYGFNNPVSMIDPMGTYGGLATGPGQKYFTDRDPRSPAVMPMPEDAKVRIGGAIRIAAGVAGMVGSALTVNGVTFVIEWDDATAGTNELFTGRPHDSNVQRIGQKATSLVTDDPSLQRLGGDVLQLGVNSGSAIWRGRQLLKEGDSAFRIPGDPQSQSAPQMPAKHFLDNIATRDLYHARLDSIDAEIAAMRAKGATPEVLARRAHELRNEAKLTAREHMADRKLAESLPPAMTWEEAMKKYGGDFEAIIVGAQRSNKKVDVAVEAMRKAQEEKK